MSWSPSAGRDAARLLDQVDLALNLAKQRGRNQTVLYSEERSADLANRILVITEMRKALERNEFRLHFQPLVDVVHGTVAGAEALMRWDSPELGTIEPTRLILIAEDTGMIVRLDDFALRAALDELRARQRMGRRTVPVVVNVSTMQFQRPEFVDEIEDAIRRAVTAPGLLSWRSPRAW